jgi:hypothetical protein
MLFDRRTFFVLIVLHSRFVLKIAEQDPDSFSCKRVQIPHRIYLTDQVLQLLVTETPPSRPRFSRIWTYASPSRDKPNAQCIESSWR